MSGQSGAAGRCFHHPYEPYGIQTVFMNALYDCIEDGCVGIFESPTGTGKSLSLICGSLTWLRDQKRKAFESQIEEAANADDGDCDEPTWVTEHAEKQKRQAILQKRRDLEARLAKVRAREKRQQEPYKNGEPRLKKLKKNTDAETTAATNSEAQFLLDEYESDEEHALGNPSPFAGLSATTQELMEKLGMGLGRPKAEDAEVDDELKVFYCSRTHSQLTQFVSELRHVKMPTTIPSEDPTESDMLVQVEEGLKHLSLGSRRNLCIHPKVSACGSANAINEGCLELQKPGTPAASKCSYLPTKDNEALVNSFRDHALAEIRDIEDLSALGKKLDICPYYAIRPTIKPSEVKIVTLPYPLLLQKSAREALNLSLKGHVVIIDEAHNLMDAIANLHSASISLSQLKISRAQLGVYLQKFRNRLKGKNRVYVAQIVRVLDSLTTYIEGKASGGQKFEGIVKTGELMAGRGADQINLYKLMHYLQESKLARKVEGYVAHLDQQKPQNPQNKRVDKSPSTASTKKPEATTPVLTHIQGFLHALTNPSAEGRIFLNKTEDNDICLEYLLLDPTHHFREIVEEARAVVLAGGTMSPMSDYIDHLFSYVSPDRIRTLSCGHVIPAQNLTACAVSKGPTGVDFEFTFEKRNLDAMVDELGRSVLNMCSVIPDGVVIFFSSYSYLEVVAMRWQKTSVWEQLLQCKQIFRESKGSASVEEMLQEYSGAIDRGRGGLLLSVTGGKMSEGINFSDKLGRGVIMVGLPFPNIHSVEWKAKLEHVEKAVFSRQETETTSGGTSRTQARAAGREFYENACMRAVNQSIGRAIRHRNDYAAILLLDRRFEGERVRNKLPGWIQKGLVKDASRKPFTEVMGNLGAFFRSKEF
ncbi:MAG: ATP-dependent DNA helicase chl1 [Geoglossum simile]|nr:MAG: ATP-dependent DNA helicase chl1 [Geoglossum simile]